MSNITTIRVCETIEEARAAVLSAKAEGETIGFVPTMGALHQGHLSLVKAAQAECDRTVVSIFVNPTQFEPHEDFHRYPRVLDEDLKKLESLGCWLVFAPSVEEMYPPDAVNETIVDVGTVARSWEGVARPHHFGGVATVVLKLFQIVPADRAYFGRKDYQQSLVVRHLVEDLSVPISIRVCPTVREPDGLAMSSRNVYLSPAERSQAQLLWKSLQLAEQLYADGEKDAHQILEQMKRLLSTAEDLSLEYIACLAEGTVRPVETITGPTVIALAARVGQTRLIDNHMIG